MKNLFSWLLLIAFTYANHFWLVPGFYLKHKRWLYWGIVVLGLAIVLFLPNLPDQFATFLPPSSSQHPMPPPMSPMSDGMPIPTKPPIVMELSHVVLLFIVSVLFSISYLTQSRLRDVEQQRLESELAHLKAQIHPHFLFNTLNSIYALAIRKNDKTADAVVQLSEFLRYVIRDAQHHEVPLEKELAYIRNYIDLQESRLRDSVAISLQVQGEANEHQIVPLILFSFIENAFKHGVNPEEESVIDIRIDITETQVRLLVYNKKVHVDDPNSEAGIGMKNARKRLKLLYPEQHTLSISDTATDYTVELTISM
ncbi:MAG: histidine kinase [Saprospiraceae bacterium]|nr:histidine kinase [Lewinella sp.]